jgi:hypothetical protein
VRLFLIPARLSNTAVFFKFWMLTKDGAIQKDPLCIDYNKYRTDIADKTRVYTYNCNREGAFPFQKWSFENGLLKHVSTSLCLELNSTHHEFLNMRECDVKNKYQRWNWSKRIPKLSHKHT